MIAFERRASSILFNFLSSLGLSKTFLLPANVCPIVPIAFMKARVGYQFIDISPHTLSMDEDAALGTLRTDPDRYGGIVYVRTYGAMRDVDEFFASVKEISEQLLVIDDRCLVAPSFDEPKGGSSDLILYSTGYSKYVDLGWGGFGFLRGAHRYARASFAYRPEDLDAITGQYKTCLEARTRFMYTDSNWLDGDTPPEEFVRYRDLVVAKAKESAQRKAYLNSLYRETLPEAVHLPAEFQEWRFNIYVPQKQHLLSAIFAADLFASSHYASLDGVFSDRRSPNAEAVHARVVNLFNDRYFNERQAMRVGEIAREHLRRFGTG